MSNLAYNLSNSTAKNLLNVKNIDKNNIDITKPTLKSISISTDKLRYVMGESVSVFGTINTNDTAIQNKKVIIQLDILSNSSKRIPGWLQGLNLLIKEKENDNSSHIFYNSSFFTNKTFFSYTILNTQNSGTYKVTATLDGSNEKAFTTFEVENLFTTISANIIYIGTIASIILIFIMSYWAKEFKSLEISNFLLLTILVFTPIIASLLSDVSLGPNSPVGVVIKHPVDETGKIKLDDLGRPEQGGQWVFNIGGSQHNNYSNGIQIPMFVVLLGLIGGYLRFLYDRATVHSEHITKTFDEIDKVVDKDTSIDEKYQNLELPISYRLKRSLSALLHDS